MDITWHDKVTNSAVMDNAGSLSMHLILCKRRLRWLGYVCRMEDGRIPKDLLYGELAAGQRPVDRPALRFKDVCKCDLKCTGLDTDSWEALAVDRSCWRHAVSNGIQRGERVRTLQLVEREQRKARQKNVEVNPQSEFVCNHCGRNCHARIGLLSHSKYCYQHV